MAICPTVFAMLSVCTITLTEVKSFTDSVRDTLKFAPMFGYNVGFAFLWLFDKTFSQNSLISAKESTLLENQQQQNQWHPPTPPKTNKNLLKNTTKTSKQMNKQEKKNQPKTPKQNKQKQTNTRITSYVKEL